MWGRTGRGGQLILRIISKTVFGSRFLIARVRADLAYSPQSMQNKLTPTFKPEGHLCMLVQLRMNPNFINSVL